MAREALFSKMGRISVAPFMQYLLLVLILGFCSSLPAPLLWPPNESVGNGRLDKLATNGKKLIGYWGLGRDHSAAELEKHAHVLLFLGVNSNCTLTPPPQTQVDYIHSSGALALGGVGGYAMDDKWSTCSADYLALQLIDILTLRNLDGIQIDYQREPRDDEFLMELFGNLRSALPMTKHVTLAVANKVMVPPEDYIEALSSCGGSPSAEVDFYNYMTSSLSDVYHHKQYLDIVKDMYGVAATETIFGSCIIGCNTGTNAVQLEDEEENVFPAMTCTIK